MKPRPFDYVRPDTVKEAVAILAEHGYTPAEIRALRAAGALGGGPQASPYCTRR